MATLRIERVLALPAVENRTASTMYVVKGSNGVLNGIYFTGTTAAEIQHVYGQSEVETLVAGQFAAFNNILAFPTYAAMLASGQTRNAMAMVLDATGDPTVKAGAAMYFYNIEGSSWTKVTEYESLDLQLTWEAISGKPTSAVADIDDAVAKRHVHANKELIDQVGEDADQQLTYRGALVKAAIAVTEW